MWEEILMAVGAFIWIVGEMIGVYKGVREKKAQAPAGRYTTTDYVRHYRSKSLLVRVLTAAFTVWLFLHFNYGMLG